MDNTYTSPICEYCRCTDMGTQAVGTGPWNMCEGLGCEEALTRYNEEHPDDIMRNIQMIC